MQRGQGAGGDDLEIGGDKIGIRSGETQACPSGGMTSLATEVWLWQLWVVFFTKGGIQIYSPASWTGFPDVPRLCVSGPRFG